MGKYSSIKRSLNHRGTRGTHIVIINKSSETLRLIWLDFSHHPKSYATLKPGDSKVQSTFSTHTWVIENADGDIWHSYQGDSAIISLQACNSVTVEDLPEEEGSCIHTVFGQYSACGHANGIPIRCFTCVSSEAVCIAEDVVCRMMECMPQPIANRMRQHGAAVAIIGEKQQTHDIPEFRLLRYQGTKKRGFGGTRSNPVCCVAEENVLMKPQHSHSSESILVHEFAHSVMNIGFDAATMKEVRRLYTQAHARRTYDPSVYLMSNSEEYWAETSQAWWEATVRTDVTDGVRTRWQLANRDPELAALMLRVYGRNEWRYPETAPCAFRHAAPPCSGRSLEDVELRLCQNLQVPGEGAGTCHAAAAADGKAGPEAGVLVKARRKIGGKLRKFVQELSG